MTLIRIKALLFTGTAILLALHTYAQSTAPGFVQQDVIKVSGVTTAAQVNALPLGSIQTSRMFIDGLGRPVQTVALQASPVNNNDVVQPQAYNALGQQTSAYLPYTDNSTVNPAGSYRNNAIANQLTYYQNSGTSTNPNAVANEVTYPFSQKVFENSPLQRVLSAGMTGTGFQPGVSGNHYKKINYRLNNNTQDGNILIWSTSGIFTTGNYYADDLLSVTDGTDEDGVEARSYTDAAGRLILKRQLIAGAYLDTYYVYNTGGIVSYVIPPKALSTMVSVGYNLSNSIVSTLIFIFTYDNLGRLIEKTVPAKGKMSIVYDPLNRPVLMQDALMNSRNQWNYVRYDVKGRAISQGIYTDSNASRLGRSAMQAYVSSLSYTTYYETPQAASGTGYYTANVFPTSATGTLTPLAYAYFDGYALNPGGASFSYSTQGLTGEEAATTAPVKGMPTMVRKTAVGAGVTGGTWLLSVTFYDKRLNPIQTRSNNHIYNTLDVVTDASTTVPDFMGVPKTTLVKKVTGTGTANTVTIQTNLTYDYMYRIKAVDQYYNGSATVSHVATYSYNEMGQLVSKSLGYVNSTTWLQNVNMRYNIRGQLLSINNGTLTADALTNPGNSNALFGMTLLYDQTDSNLGNTPYYNGKPSAIKWMSVDAAGNKSYQRAFKYYYDNVDRDTAAIYAERTTAATGAFTTTNGWNENRITYDENGNIKTMFRDSAAQGAGNHFPIDNLAYTYNSSNPNQLLSVTDGTTAQYKNSGFRNYTGSTSNYAYDVNGNLVTDPYKGLTIGYNYLNRTDKITVTTSVNRFINYTYNADGSLLRKQQYDNNVLQITTDYIDGFVYITSGGGSATLQYCAMPEGRLLNNAGTLSQDFILTDQQGNARIEFDNSGTGGTAKVRQENSYYAFGLIMPGSLVIPTTNDNKHLYNGGSEWQKDYSNLPDYYQTFYRNYDAALGRFIGVDPMAESAESMTSYQYAGNSPIVYNDPLGNLKVNPIDYPDYYKPLGLHSLPQGGGPIFGVDEDDSDPYLNDALAWAASIDAANYWSNQINTQWNNADAGNDGGNNTPATANNDISNYTNSGAPVQTNIESSSNNNSGASFGPLDPNLINGKMLEGVIVTDKYSYAGDLYHIPIDDDHIIPAPGSTDIQINKYLCTFWAMQVSMKYYGKDWKALDLMVDYANKTKTSLGKYFSNGVNVDPASKIDELTPLLNTYFTGRYAVDYSDLSNSLKLYPVIGSINLGEDLGHSVMFTGVNANGSYQYFDVQTGKYQPASGQNIVMPFIVTGIK